MKGRRGAHAWEWAEASVFFKKKTETKGAVANGAAKAAPTAGPQPAVEIPPAAPATVTAKVEPAPAPAAAPASTAPADSTPAANTKSHSQNAIRNSAFTAWSRGDRFDKITAQQPIVDDWLVSFGPGGVKSVSVSRGAPPPGKGGCSLVIDVSEAGDGSSWFALHQRIPDVGTLAGRKVTLGFWARSTVSAPVGIGLSQVYGPDKERVVTWGTSTPLQADWHEHAINLELPTAQLVEDGQETSLNLDLNLPKGVTGKIEFALITLLEAK